MTTVLCSWTAPADGGSAITGYVLQRRVGTGVWATIASPGAAATSYTDSTVADATQYGYRLAAVNAIGQSAFSSEATITTPSTGGGGGVPPGGGGAGAGPLPYDVPTFAALRALPGKVYPHWFTPHQISADDVGPPGPDYYDTYFLPPGAVEGSRDHRPYGGFYRDRPIRRASRGAGYANADRRTQAQQMYDAGMDGAIIECVSILNGYLWDRVVNCYDEVNALGLSGSFDVVLMMDMTSGAISGASQQTVVDTIKAVWSKPAAYKIAGRMQVSWFAPEAAGKTASYYQGLLDLLSAQGCPCDFIACYVNQTTPSASALNSVMTMHGRWGDRDPVSSGSSGVQNRGGAQYIYDTYGKPYLGYVAPGDERPWLYKYWESRLTEEFRTTWDAAINGNGTAQGKSTWIQIPTWNDYSEGACIEPTRNHGMALIDLGWYFLIKFKTGAFPAVARDCLFLSHRTEFAAGMTYTSPYFNAPQVLQGGTAAADLVEVLAFAVSAATVYITRGATTTTHSVVAGLNVITVPLVAGAAGSISAYMSRDSGATAVAGTYIVSPWAVSHTKNVMDKSMRLGSSLRGWSASYPDTIPSQAITIT